MKSIIIAAFLAIATISCNNNSEGSAVPDSTNVKIDSTNAIDNTGTGTTDTGKITTDTSKHKMTDTSKNK